jgi:flavin-dependent dehydrogenase
MLALDELGVALDVPHVEVIRGGACTPVGDVDLTRNGDVLCTVIRRDQFDAQLARAARRAGLEIVEQSRVLDVSQNDDGVRVATERGVFDAKIVVGADGSGSKVRRAIFGERKATLGRALMMDIAVDPERTPEFVERRYRFDFRCVSNGIKGYAWSFPCILDGRPYLNVGIYDQRPRDFGRQSGAQVRGEQSRMLEQLGASFPELQLDAMPRQRMSWQAAPIRWFDAADEYVRGRVMLAGDAAGVDPLMGEGISCAFEHGRLAARALDESLGGAADALASYDRELHRGAVGRKLAKLGFAARHFYGAHYRWFFRIARVSRTAQEVGVDWYNGARHLDELPTRNLLARLARGVLLGAPLR